MYRACAGEGGEASRMVRVASRVDRCAGRCGAADRSHRFGLGGGVESVGTGVAGAGTGS